MEPARSVCLCFGGRSPVVIYDLTEEFIYITQIYTLNMNSSMEPAWIVCPYFGGISPVVHYDLTGLGLYRQLLRVDIEKS